MRWSVWVLVCLLWLGFSAWAKADFHKACDSFIFLADESESMSNPDELEGRPKIEIEKEILSVVNLEVPEADYQAELRTFGHDYVFSNPYQSAVYFPIGPYCKQSMAEAIEKIRASRAPTPLGYGLELAGKDAAEMPGRVHIILFTDGKENAYRPSPEVAREIKAKYPDKICLFAVQVGHDAKGRALLEELVSIMECGGVYQAADLRDKTKRQAFIKEVFGYEVKRAKPVAQPAPKPKPAPKVAGPVDSDGDGVYDQFDRCPNTPKGAKVDAYGCWEIGMVFFDFDQADIKPEYHPLLLEIAEVLKKNPDLKLKVIGSTDSRGDEEYNYRLGLKRARAVKAFLVAHGVNPAQLIVVSVGETQPIADNTTEEGRAKNRHVRFEIVR